MQTNAGVGQPACVELAVAWSWPWRGMARRCMPALTGTDMTRYLFARSSAAHSSRFLYGPRGHVRRAGRAMLRRRSKLRDWRNPRMGLRGRLPLTFGDVADPPTPERCDEAPESDVHPAVPRAMERGEPPETPSSATPAVRAPFDFRGFPPIFFANPVARVHGIVLRQMLGVDGGRSRLDDRVLCGIVEERNRESVAPAYSGGGLLTRRSGEIKRPLVSESSGRRR